MVPALLSDKPASRAANIARAALLPLWLALPAWAQVDDPLKSADCARALANLQSARQQQEAPAGVDALRALAAGACLGTASPAARGGRIAQPPLVVPPPQIDVAPPPAALPVPPLLPPPPPVAIERAPLPAQCDVGGCWTSDGTRLRHVAPGLLGPRGLCIQQGAQLVCP